MHLGLAVKLGWAASGRTGTEIDSYIEQNTKNATRRLRTHRPFAAIM